VLRGSVPLRTLDDRLDAVLLHPLFGVVAFAVVMALVFTALFSWAEPAIGAVEGTFSWLGDSVRAGLERALPATPWASVLTDGVVDGAIGGVGSVVVFLPQIALLFFLLALLEDSGYLARAAHLMDRVLRAAGLPGQAFVPLVSGYACAVPAILATRTLPRARDRLLTMLVIPLTSCSARLPVYTLMIAAVFPASTPLFGVDLPTRPLALFGMYALSTAMAVAASAVLGAWVLPADASATLLELPPYRAPHLPTVGRLVWRRCREFLREATGTILVATLVLWALLYFPRVTPEDVLPPEVVAAHADQPDTLAALAAGPAVAQSYAGRIGRTLEPALAPLGYDWKIGVGLIGAFAAREVFVSTLGVVYGLEDAGEDDRGLRAQLAAERTPAGRPRYTPLVGASLLVFFAFAMQCLSTLAVLRKETRGWTWPAFAVVYLSVLAWSSACLVYQGGRWLGFE
jgi:ferrous iron transport protein B